MSSIPQLHEKVQDEIQEKLQKAEIIEPIQDKLGNFALLVINDNIPAAESVCTHSLFINTQ